MGITTTAPDERQQRLLKRAREGDEAAFQDLIEGFRSELQAHCYRMLGSVHDAEDAIQNAMLRAWRGLKKFEGRSSLRSWLYKIATNTCLDEIEKRPKRILPADYAPATEPSDGPGDPVVENVWVEPYPDELLGVEDGYTAPEARYEQREAVELAFIAALQHLPPSQRAVLILREVLGYSAKETAATLETTVASVNSALQRARAAVEERTPEQTQQETLRSLGDEKVREIVDRYVEAWERNDVEAVVDLLAEDAAISMPPLASWFGPKSKFAEFLRFSPMSGDWEWKAVPTQANGQPALGYYTFNPETGTYERFALNVLTLEGEKIKDVTAFLIPNPEGASREEILRMPERDEDAFWAHAAFDRFELPERIPKDG
jgi:RNA polymerase sigma-70 factor (ECF subfamily)